MYPDYKEDLYGWATANALLLRNGRFREADMEHIIQEIETLGRSSRRELVSRLGVLIAHLMKWEYQKDMRKAGWQGTIERQRIEISDVLDENPSLKPEVDKEMPKAYRYAMAILKEETPLDIKSLPRECPYTSKQCMDDSFYPG